MEGEMPRWETCVPGEDSEDSNGEDEAFEEEGAPSNNGSDDDEEEVEGGGEETGGGGGRARWWQDSVVHPNGTKNWKDLPNLLAAEAYDCRCGKKCLTRAGGALTLYEFRRSLRATALDLGQGGLRDAVRATLEPQYDRTQGAFRNTFRVGECDGACIMACAVAMGISEGTFTNARRDVTADRPRHGGRSKVRKEKSSTVAEALDGWIRLQREGIRE